MIDQLEFNRPHWVGIDVGVTGAIALLDPNGALILLEDMPTTTGRQGKRLTSAALLAQVVRDFPPGTKVIVEDQSSRPGQGVTSVFSLGRSLGVIEGVLSALGFEYDKVSPSSWKQHHRLYGADKDFSRTRALELDPELAPYLKRKQDHGRAEAYLIARYGMANEGGSV